MQTLVPTDVTSDLFVAYEAEDYAASIPGFDIDVCRTGHGTGPNVTRSTRLTEGMVSSTVVQFPMLGKARIGENTILINLVTSAPPGSRWCGIDIQPGTVMLYGPESPHTGITPVGFSFSFIALDIKAIEETADRLELDLELPDRGRVRTLDLTEGVRSLTRSLHLLGDPVEPDGFDGAYHLDTVHTAVAALSLEPHRHGAGGEARIDSRHVVHVCIEYAEAIERVPTISEMRLVAHVSERRLRGAFNEIFGVPPLRYFRHKFLDKARCRLVNGQESGQNVGGIASDLGFHNFGRFARHYKATYGELPSVTLQAVR